MGLQFKVTDLNAVPEALRSAYVKDGEAWRLDVEGGVVPEADVKGLKESRDKVLSEKKEILRQYNELLESEKLTQAGKAALEEKIEELRRQTMTPEQLREHEAKVAKRARDEAEAEKAKVKAEADKFQKLFTDSQIRAALLGAAQESGAYSAEQVHGLLAGRTVLEEVRDDEGKPTGVYVPKTTVTVLDGEKHVEKTLPTPEAVKAFLGQPGNKNLVNSTASPGGGARQGGQAATGAGKSISRQQFETLSPQARMDHVKSGGVLHD